MAQARYRQKPVSVELRPGHKGGVLVNFLSPQRALTPGQLIAFYQGSRLWGCATIEKTAPSYFRRGILSVEHLAESFFWGPE